MSKSIILLLDGVRGQYIPRDFAQIIQREYIQGVSLELLESLAKDDAAEYDEYWDNWHSVLDNAKILFNGVEYTLHHDGDLWLINFEAMTEQEREDFGFND